MSEGFPNIVAATAFCLIFLTLPGIGDITDEL
jgi:hypothetical protein